MAADDLFNLASELLGFAVVALGDTAPARQYISPTLPVLECDTLCVYWQTISIPVTSPSQPPTQVAHKFQLPNLNYIGMTLLCSRCVPVAGAGASAPDPLGLTLAAQQISEDAWILWNGIKRAKKRGTLFAPSEREMEMSGGLTVMGQGGVGGTTINIQISLDGWDPGF